ncbi:MAG: hypothetical protein HY652_04145 [Acidobacteria bacterium]|nr:hypothetical protein [Acidobacteriota bacterium]
MRTTLTLDEDVAAKLKTETRKSGQSFRQTVNYFLRLGLNLRREMKHANRFVVRARPLGQRPGLNYDNIGELLEQLEGPTHR